MNRLRTYLTPADDSIVREWQRRLINSLQFKIARNKAKIQNLCDTNEMYSRQLKIATIIDQEQKQMIKNLEELNWKVVIELETRLDHLKEEYHSSNKRLENELKVKEDQERILRIQLKECKKKQYQLQICKEINENNSKHNSATEVDQLKNENQLLRQQLDEMKLHQKSSKLNINGLREACFLLEGQVLHYEQLNKKQKQDKGHLEKTTNSVRKQFKEIKQELLALRKYLQCENSENKLFENTEFSNTKEISEVDKFEHVMKKLLNEVMDFEDTSRSTTSIELSDLKENLANFLKTLFEKRIAFLHQIDTLECDLAAQRDESEKRFNTQIKLIEELVKKMNKMELSML